MQYFFHHRVTMHWNERCPRKIFFYKSGVYIAVDCTGIGKGVFLRKIPGAVSRSESIEHFKQNGDFQEIDGAGFPAETN